MTDRTLRDLADLDEVDFGKAGGLVPVVAQDARTGGVLMVAHANREALDASIETGELHFWSRSRAALWRKGETSGNVLRLVSLHADCDGDVVLARVEPTGAACHTGERTCFGEGAEPSGTGAVLEALARVIEARAAERPDGSYTVRLLDDANLRLKKLGEESAELIAALALGETARVAEEAADLVYHLLVALRGAGVSPETMAEVLKGRAG